MLLISMRHTLKRMNKENEWETLASQGNITQTYMMHVKNKITASMVEKHAKFMLLLYLLANLIRVISQHICH